MSKSTNDSSLDVSTSGKYATRVEQNLEKDITLSSYDRTYNYVATSAITCLHFVRTLKLETFCFIYLFSFAIRSVSSVTMIVDKCCRGELAFSDEICSNLNEERYKMYKIQVETIANNYQLYHTLILFTPSVLLAPFIGPWSDKYGRKPPMIVAVIGSIIDGTGTILCAYFMDSSVKLYLIPPVFNGLSGGLIAILTTMYSYASDITGAKSRSFKYALLKMAAGFGGPLGALAGGWIFKFWGYTPVFSVGVIGAIFSLFWVIFVLEETRGQNDKDTLYQKLQNLVSVTNLIEGFKVTTKRRPHKGRLQIWMLILAMSVAELGVATQGIGYLYVYHLFDWSNTKFSTVSAIFTVISVFAMLSAVPLLTKVFKFGDPAIGLMGSFSSMIMYLLLALSVYGQGIYYLANLLGLFVHMTTLAGMSRISKLVSKSDLGKVFAFISAAEGILPILASIFITRLYNATVGSGNPGLSYYIVAFVLGIDVVIYIWLARLPSVNYEELQEEREKDKELSKFEEESQT